MGEPISAAVTWVGQAGFIIENRNGDRCGIDLFLSDHELRTGPAPRIEQLGRLPDLVLATHEHGDHLDLPALRLIRELRRIRAQATMTVAVPKGLVTMVQAAGLEPVVGLESGETVRLPGFSITGVDAVHGVRVEDGYATTASGADARWLGYVVTPDGGPTFWHGGDTLVPPALAEQIAPLGIDIALLPINGRDADREGQGIVGNMSVEEAVSAAVAVGATTLIPMHHDAIRGNTAPAGAAAEEASRQGAPLSVLSLEHLVAQVVQVPHD
jgi:L-ascorbate 6-phosphate lactonase